VTARAAPVRSNQACTPSHEEASVQVRSVAVVTAVALVLAAPSLAQDAAGSAVKAVPLPIREVTVFKDGHAFVVREGELATDAAGNVVVDDLPQPVLGTFWPYADQARAKLTGVVAGRRSAAVERTALGVADLLRANVGAEATFQETGGRTWSGKVLGLPERTAAEAAALAQPGAPRAAAAADTVLVETVSGTLAVAVARIESVTFRGACRTTPRTEEPRDLLTLQLAWDGARAEKARVGLVYLQHGLRWIPSYRIDTDGAGRAKVRLQATLVNDLADLERAAVHLVVGVPKFDFRETLDPMALQAEGVEVARRAARSRMRDAFSNGLQAQTLSYAESATVAAAGDPGALAAGVAGAGATEDLFVFDLADVSLRRGERMTVSVADFEVPYTDVYVADVPLVPPLEILGERQREPDEVERAVELMRPTAMHRLRLENTSSFPLTTAPAVVLRGGRLLGQGRTSYTPSGRRCDVSVTQAVALRVTREDVETKRTPAAERWNGNEYHRVDLAAKVVLANDGDRAFDVEVQRSVLGIVDAAERDGVVTPVHVGEDLTAAAALRSAGWGWLSPAAWRNGVGRVTWKVRVEPGATVELPYRWHYFWR
jgi:hypothetical protein